MNLMLLVLGIDMLVLMKTKKAVIIMGMKIIVMKMEKNKYSMKLLLKDSILLEYL
jgi:hypothetical protein